MTDETLEDKLFKKIQENHNIESLIIPPPSFTVMNCKIIEYSEEEQFLTTKIPVSKEWMNPYNTMQGGFINAAIDNAVGPLSLLVAPMNMTRTMETKFLKAITLDFEYIFVTAVITEQRRKRVTFEVTVKDIDGCLLVQAKVINFII